MDSNLARQKRNGFTLLEMLVVLGILSVLVTFVLVSLDPLTQFAESRNARRWSDVNAITTAVYEYIVKNSALPTGIDGTIRQIGTASSGCNTVCAGASASCLNMSENLRPYLEKIPFDPSVGSVEQTGYSIQVNENNVVTVRACAPENNQIIEMLR